MLDQDRIRRGFERAAPDFDKHDFVYREIRERLLARIDALQLDVRDILDLGAGTGAAMAGLNARFPAARVLPVDLTHAMLNAGGCAGVCADAARLPLPAGSVDLIFSNLLLHHCADPAAVLAESRRVLRYPGVLLFTTFGPDSMVELGRAWATADHFSHIAPFADMHNVGDALVQAGFAEPVIDRQALTITYGDFDKLIHDLRHAGSTNATEHRNPGLTGRGAAQRLRAAYAALADADGKLPVSLEIVFGLAWVGDPAGHSSERGEIEFPLDRLGLRPGRAR